MATLERATLSPAERLALERFVAGLSAALGPELEAVWLYGSRARRERPHPESDIDVLILTREGEAHRSLSWSTALEAGADGLKITPITTTRAWIEERRAIDSFFLREVDRDKIVVYGEG